MVLGGDKGVALRRFVGFGIEGKVGFERGLSQRATPDFYCHERGWCVFRGREGGILLGSVPLTHGFFNQLQTIHPWSL